MAYVEMTLTEGRVPAEQPPNQYIELNGIFRISHEAAREMLLANGNDVDRVRAYLCKRIYPGG